MSEITTTSPAMFTEMEGSTKQQWDHIARETQKGQSRTPLAVLSMLGSLSEVTDGFATNQLTHVLQTATRAERDGASIEMIVACLCHDIGKAISVPNHPKIAAEILAPYVSPETYSVIATHQDFQGRHYYQHFGLDPNRREQYADEPWFGLAEQFADQWDQKSFDPNYDTFDLDHFRPMVEAVFSRPKAMIS